MNPSNQTHKRRSLRLTSYDYSRKGAYFVTICSWRHQCVFGCIVDGNMYLNEAGTIVQQAWQAIPNHFSHIERDVFVVMPNHIHGILFISDYEGSQPAPLVGAQHAAPFHENPARVRFGKLTTGSLSIAIRSFKSAVTHQVNQTRRTAGKVFWQRNYWEHVIRNESDLNSIREYIQNNPAQWELDKLNPDYD